MTENNEFTIRELKLQLSELERKYEYLEEALMFYALKENWYPGDSFKQSCRIDENDLEYFPASKTADLVGGKLARQVLKSNRYLT